MELSLQLGTHASRAGHLELTEQHRAYNSVMVEEAKERNPDEPPEEPLVESEGPLQEQNISVHNDLLLRQNIGNGQPEQDHYYLYYQQQRSESERRAFLSAAVFRAIYETVYLTPVLALYILNSGKDCGTSLKALVFSEIMLRLFCFNIIRFPLLIFSKRSAYLLCAYKIFAILKFFLMFLWCTLFIILFWISKPDCMKKGSLLFVASLLVLAQCVMELVMKIFLFSYLIILAATHRLNPEMRALSKMRLSPRLITKIITKLKFLQLKDAELDKNQDICCICLENFQDDPDAIFLPCNKKHIFHYPCISEWVLTQPSCPMCKSVLSAKAIEGAIKELRSK
ncbi:unnamed protein product [Moneuplotes crassus]|uniref:RING-type domain-containing protein n=1 Tax=Euplotes crassus TaxID=5936 RepID=A0AAD1XML4_EUPCR|nr:unnamed protein product [Moneuplotes crassus]